MEKEQWPASLKKVLTYRNFQPSLHQIDERWPMACQLQGSRADRNFKTASKNGGGDIRRHKSDANEFRINYQQIHLEGERKT
jgi:hypothetical protein